MKLYHGSHVGGITELKPAQSGSTDPRVYFSTNETLALIYAHNPVRPYGFFPYVFLKDGKICPEGQLCYEEYFHDAMRVIYSGHGGWVYTCDAELTQHERLPWAYTSTGPVKVESSYFVPDIYEAMLEAERDGRLVVHRYETLSEQRLESIRRMALREVETMNLRDEWDTNVYALFLREHYPWLDEELTEV